ncbi:hypothetical protein JRO89_XS06G0113900 [Xanthoceras sorbifolium]|uniref:RNase H type-1 domain-containing protein n=1 Tax=Xanthoceras sorbifolium TaxID=99658 RepID=A0ABQ8HXR4_9ROSI|nr:hypothetical protein JRO89_XS06G0113900 [Xanthoceras sorbifolium]
MFIDVVRTTTRTTIDSGVPLQLPFFKLCAEFVAAGCDLVEAVNFVSPSFLVAASHVWRPPDQDLFEINSDAALSVSEKMVGLGVVIRDSKGLVMLSSSRNLDACYSPNIAEAKAILFGMQLAIDSGLLPAVVEFIFALRNLNMVAHQLAKMALVKDVDFVVLEEVSSSLCLLVQEDIASL